MRIQVVGLLVATATVILLISSASASLTPTYKFEFSTSTDTKTVVAGHININGNLRGFEVSGEMIPIDPSALTYLNFTYPDLYSTISWLMNSSNLRFFPMFPEHGEMESIGKLYIINITSSDVLEFNNVELVSNNHSFVVGGDNEKASLVKEIPYAIISVMKGEFFENEESSFLLIITDDELVLKIFNSPSYIIAPLSMVSDENGEQSSSGYISVIDSINGNELWRGTRGDWIMIAKMGPLNIHAYSPLTVLPLDVDGSIIMDVKASGAVPDGAELIGNVNSFTSGMGDGDTTGMFGSPDMLLPYITPMLNVLNGACALFDTNDTVSIDGKERRLSGMGLIRFDDAEFTIEESLNIKGTGNGKLVFVGDSIYSDIPYYSVGSVDIPLQPVALWILSIGIIVIFTFVLKRKDEDEKLFGIFPISISNRDRDIIKLIFFILNVILLILTFLLFDFAFSYMLGVSAISSLHEKNLMITGVMLGLQLFCITICYLLFALPVRLSVNTVLKFVGFEKERKGIGKVCGTVVMWIFGLGYIGFLLNVIVSIAKDVLSNMMMF
ncbi:MAG TPA: hypothetical protein ENG74_00555 [Thermoplasmatales archaeon]|nr:hypothetical protein [Thermoplasmatales archaeon]